jgi:superfamily I DNA/RNA helicase
MTNITWTNAQKHAIKFNEPERLLVSAAAGSGKTAVLTERITVRALKNIVKPSRRLVAWFIDQVTAARGGDSQRHGFSRLSERSILYL